MALNCQSHVLISGASPLYLMLAHGLIDARVEQGPGDSAAWMSRSIPNINRFRLERFGKAMSGTGSWELPGAVFMGMAHSLNGSYPLFTLADEDTTRI